MTPIFRSSSASPLIHSNKTALFQMSPSDIIDTSNREQPLDLTVLCKSEIVDKGTEKTNGAFASIDAHPVSSTVPTAPCSSTVTTSDVPNFGFSGSENTLIMASGVPSRYHVVMTPGLGTEYSLLMPVPMPMQLPTVLASNQQPNTVRIETSSSSSVVNTGGISSNVEHVSFPQFQTTATPFGVAVSQSQQSLNIFQTAVPTQAGRSQTQVASSAVALHPQMMQQLSVQQPKDHQALTPIAVSQPVSQLSYRPQQTPRDDATTNPGIQQQLQNHSAVQSVNRSLQYQSAAQNRQAQTSLAPQPARRGRKPGSRGGKSAKPAAGMGEMKIIQENTTFPGVYTSIIKLPWYRRARYKSHADKESRSQTTKASSVLFPMESVMTASSQPSTTAADTHPEPSTTQSVMMVYPNATISALGKPVRRRGRPPKLPLISHLLAEKNSRSPVSVTQVTTTIANQEAASMLADGSLMSFLSKESIGASSVNDIKVTGNSSNQMDTHVPVNAAYQIEHRPINQIDILSTKNETSSPESAAKKAKGDSMYQEMILSSRELISVKPRKRQLNNYMKSEDHFLCSSFKLKPRKTKTSRTAASELAERRKHIQTDTVSEPYLVGKPLEILASKLNPQTSSGVSTDQQGTAINHSASYSRPQCETSHEINSQKLGGHSLCNLQDSVDIKSEVSEVHFNKDNTQVTLQMESVEQFCKNCKVQIMKKLSNSDTQDMIVSDVLCEKCKDADSERAAEQEYSAESGNNISCLDVPQQSDSGEYETKISCDLCGMYFTTSHQLGDHHREVHSKEAVQGEEEYDCSFCGEVFCDVEQLRPHVQSHKPDLIPCDMGDCPQFFVTHEDLARHVKEHEKKRLFACVYDGCKNRFLKNFHLQEHVRVKHFNIRAFRCPWSGCEKHFAAERHLKVHLLIHREEKPLECEFCNYRCRQRNALNWHMRKHPEAPYKYRKFGMLGSTEDM